MYVVVGVTVFVCVEAAPLTVEVIVVVEAVGDRQRQAEEICVRAVYLDRQAGFLIARLTLPAEGVGGTQDEMVIVS